MKDKLDHWVIVRFLLITICNTLSSSTDAVAQQKTSAVHLFAIKNINVIPMTLENDIIQPTTTVIIKNNRIESLNGPIPKGTIIINGKGKWLIPGLIDTHIHPPADFSLHPGVLTPFDEPVLTGV